MHKGKHIVHVETGEKYVLTHQSYIPVIPKKSDEDNLNERIIDLKWKRQTKSHDPEEYYLEELFRPRVRGQ
jgi:hypothetical protein